MRFFAKPLVAILLLVVHFELVFFDLAVAEKVNSGMVSSPAAVSQGVVSQVKNNKAKQKLFPVPAGLQNRVNFWIDVFTKHGKRTVVFHHRRYPQAIFDVVDLTAQTAGLPEILRAKYKSKFVKKHVKVIRSALQRLASGSSPTTRLEKRIVESMSFLPAGTKKYKEVVTRKLIRTQTGIKEKFITAIERSGRYLPVMERIFKEHELPVELTRMPFIESSFDYSANSSVGAAGIWQFMPRTGKLYRLKINYAVDERRDPVKASDAAARYLKNSYKSLKNWPLAITSYNHGPYGVKKAVKKMGTKDITKIVEHPGKRVFGFASNNFYPEFLAALEVYRDREFYFPGIKTEAQLRFDQIIVPKSVSARFVLKQLDLKKDDLLPLNYALKNSIWQGRALIPKGYVLKVPVGYGTRAAKLKEKDPWGYSASVSSGSSIYGGVSYRVRRGDTLSGIAKKFKTSVRKLKSLNSLRSNTIRVGQLLLVKEKSASARGSASIPKSGIYKVRRGDSLSSIGRRYGVSISKLKSLNGLRSSVIKVGQTLKLRESVKSISSVKQSSAKTYKVRRGDSLWSISKKFGISIQSLKRINGLKGSGIRVGQRLKVQ